MIAVDVLFLAAPLFAGNGDSAVPAPDPSRETAIELVEAHVTAVLGDFVVLDVGSEYGVLPGDLVTLYPPGAATREAIVREVSARTARAQLLAASTIPVDLAAARAEVRTSRPAAEAFPWRAPAPASGTDEPLLAPARPLRPAERDVRWSGRAYFALNLDRDEAGDGADFLLGRAGIDGMVENPFGKGGTLDFDVEVARRSIETIDVDEGETRLRVDRLSYSLGGTRFEDSRLQFGRFLPREFPQLGLLDGVEYSWMLGEGDRVGVHAGLLPEPTAELDSHDDTSVAAWWRRTAGENGALDFGLAAQKTWHEGHADRDLVVLDGRWHASEGWSLGASAWFDVYGGSDERDGIELSEGHFDANWRSGADFGFGFFATHFAFPELERFEFTPLPDDEAEEARVSRLGAHAWRGFGDDWRLSGRLDRWSDEEDGGGSGELGLEKRDLFDHGAAGAAVFASSGTFTDLVGARIHARSRFAGGFARASFEATDRERADDLGEVGGDGLRQRLRAGYDASLGGKWTISLDGETRFGADERSHSLGLFLQRRF